MLDFHKLDQTMLTQTLKSNWIAEWYKKQDQRKRMQNFIENHEMDFCSRNQDTEPHTTGLESSVTKKL
jgi:hypothetical protein